MLNAKNFETVTTLQLLKYNCKMPWQDRHLRYTLTQEMRYIFPAKTFSRQNLMPCSVIPLFLLHIIKHVCIHGTFVTRSSKYIIFLIYAKNLTLEYVALYMYARIYVCNKDVNNRYIITLVISSGIIICYKKCKLRTRLYFYFHNITQ